MKKFGLLIGLMVALLMTGCAPEPYEPQEELLYGIWVEGTEYYQYTSDYRTFERANGTTVQVNGTTWDSADDITVDEQWNQPFTWTLNGDNLVQVHRLYSSNADVPKSYTVTKLTDHELVYTDNYGQTHTFKKV